MTSWKDLVISAQNVELFQVLSLFFLNERAQDCAYFIDIAERYNQLAGARKKKKKVNLAKLDPLDLLLPPPPRLELPFL